MARRNYRVTLNAEITVDDESVQSFMLGFRLGDNPDLPPTTDEQIFNAQAAMLSSVATLPPDMLLLMALVNGFYLPTRESLTELLESRLDGAEVRLGDIEVNEA